jgi:hypothetical protein
VSCQIHSKAMLVSGRQNNVREMIRSALNLGNRDERRVKPKSPINRSNKERLRYPVSSFRRIMTNRMAISTRLCQPDRPYIDFIESSSIQYCNCKNVAVHEPGKPSTASLASSRRNTEQTRSFCQFFWIVPRRRTSSKPRDPACEGYSSLRSDLSSVKLEMK